MQSPQHPLFCLLHTIPHMDLFLFHFKCHFSTIKKSSCHCSPWHPVLNSFQFPRDGSWEGDLSFSSSDCISQVNQDSASYQPEGKIWAVESVSLASESNFHFWKCPDTWYLVHQVTRLLGISSSGHFLTMWLHLKKIRLAFDGFREETYFLGVFRAMCLKLYYAHNSPGDLVKKSGFLSSRCGVEPEILPFSEVSRQCPHCWSLGHTLRRKALEFLAQILHWVPWFSTFLGQGSLWESDICAK